MILVVLLLNKRASASCVPMIALHNERKGGRERCSGKRERERERERGGGGGGGGGREREENIPN